MTRAEFGNWWAGAGLKSVREHPAQDAWYKYLKDLSARHAVRIQYIRDVPEEAFDEFVAVHTLLFG